MTPSRVKKLLTISSLISRAPYSRFYPIHPRRTVHANDERDTPKSRLCCFFLGRYEEVEDLQGFERQVDPSRRISWTGRGALQSDSSLYGADLSGADLSGANLEGAYLEGAILDDTIR